MKIVIIIYVVSWFILLAFYIATHFGKKNNHSSEKEPWHLYAIIIAFAPLIVLYIPYLLISSSIEKKRKKAVKEQEQREAEENANKQRASQEIQAAINEQQEEFILCPMVHLFMLKNARKKIPEIQANSMWKRQKESIIKIYGILSRQKTPSMGHGKPIFYIRFGIFSLYGGMRIIAAVSICFLKRMQTASNFFLFLKENGDSQ